MVTPLSDDGATARALGALGGTADAVTGLLVLTDFPDCFSKLLGLTVCLDAATGFFVAGIDLAGAAFTGACLAAGFAVFTGAFFAAGTGRFAFATALLGAFCALLALARTTGLLRGAGFGFFARLAAAGLLFAIFSIHPNSRRPRVIA